MLSLLTHSNRSFRDKMVKYFSRVSCKLEQLTNILCLTVREVCKIHKLVGYHLTAVSKVRTVTQCN